MSCCKLHQNFVEPRGHSSAVASVLYSRCADAHLVTKSGSYIYQGQASCYHEWEFRIRLRVKAAGQDPSKYAEAVSKVVEGLRGDAFIVAKEVGLESLWQPGSSHQPGAEDSEDKFGAMPSTFVEAGVDILINAIKASVLPMTTHEAKEADNTVSPQPASAGKSASQCSNTSQDADDAGSCCVSLIRNLF